MNVAAKRAPAQRRGRPPREEARALFRAAILEAAEQVFAERGFHGARIHDIAERARIAVGTVYNHFAQKEDVLVALLDERTEPMADLIAHRPEDGADFPSRLRATLTRVLRYVDERRAFFAFAFDYGLLGPASSATRVVLGGRQPKHRERSRRAWEHMLREGVDAGALRATDPRELTAFFFGALRAHLSVVLAEPHRRHATPEEGAARVADLFLHGASVTEARR